MVNYVTQTELDHANRVRDAMSANDIALLKEAIAEAQFERRAALRRRPLGRRFC